MKHRTEQPYSVDALMRNVAIMLVRDFRNSLGDPGFCSDLYAAVQRGGIAGIREAAPSVSDTMGVAEYKAAYQMASLLKRYRFGKDLFSDDELREKANKAFLDTQTRIRALDYTSLSAITSEVVRIARIYIAMVLGEYSDEEHRDLCRFGRRASVGIPARQATEAARWEIPISGSHDQILWFRSEMDGIDCVQQYLAGQLKDGENLDTASLFYREVDHLTLTLVPKTFKSLRAIMPNTTIGGYMSYGLGEMMRKRLKRFGYDIRSLQQRHRVLACRGSEHGMYATADLSSASDSISVQLVDLLFPHDWRDILHRSRIGKVQLTDGSIVESETFCTMGIGYTFPLQTLVFLALLKGIKSVLFAPDVRLTISVYGDDMIYNRRLHSAVAAVFDELGFVINLDKTFHEGHFRESCGGDYYHGVDVRPFQPQNGSANVGRKAYEAVLYKYINGLLMRWSEYEVAGTLGYLLSEIGKTVGKAKVVPLDYPDDSGIKVPSLAGYAFMHGRSDVAKPVHMGHGVFRFSYLRLTPDSREEKRHEPYYWLALRDLSNPSTYVYDWKDLRDRVTVLQSVIDRECCSTYVPLLQRGRLETDVKSKDKALHCLRRGPTTVTISNTGRYTRQSGFSCFEDRRPLVLRHGG